MVSVVTLCFNYAHYLAECIESVQSQVYRDFEHIVINSGSTDNTSEIARRYPVRLLEIEDLGLSTSRNRGIALARGEYIVSLDADDTIHSSFLTQMVARAGPRIVVAPGMQNCHFSVQDQEQVNHVLCCSLFHKEDFDRIGGYDPELDRIGLEDWNLWSRLMKSGCRFVGAPGAGFYYRDHPDSSSHRLAYLDPIRYPQVTAMNRAWRPK
jgi:glycosyltransferase involved in cell wall biosynthesis